MDLVGRHGLVQPGMRGGAIVQPLRVAPHVVEPRDDGGGQRRDLEREPEGIGLQQQLAVQRRTDLEFVARPLSDPRDEDLPDAGGAEAPHRVPPAVPAVEVADHADSLGVRRPDREVDAVGLADSHQVRAKLVVNARVLALREQVDVVLGDHPSVAVRVIDLRGDSAREVDPQAIVENRRHGGKDRFEDTVVLPRHAGDAVVVQHLHSIRGWLIRADDEGAAFQVGTEDREGIRMPCTGESVEVGEGCHS